MPWPGWNGSHSQTRPARCSSHDNHVPQGVAPPAQFHLVPLKIEYAAVRLPSAANRSAPQPPRVPFSSELEVYTQPPLGTAKVEPPSGSPCQTYPVFATTLPVVASSVAAKPSGSATPLLSGVPSGPYGDT